MTEIRTLCAFAMALGLLAVPWVPAAGQPTTADTAFRERDRNGDGKLSQSESGMPPDIFTRSDADGDGVLTSQEYERGPIGPPGGSAPSQGQPRRRAAPPSRATPATPRSSQTAPQYSAAEIILAVFDTNGNGFITRKEMSATFRALDKNRNGALSKEEIAASKAAASLSRASAPPEARRPERPSAARPAKRAARGAAAPPATGRGGGADADFSRMDQNRDGRLSPDEWRLLMPPDNFGRLDADNNGSISKEEYRGQK